MKGKLEKPYENRMRDTNMKGTFLPKLKVKIFDGIDVRTWLSQLE